MRTFMHGLMGWAGSLGCLVLSHAAFAAEPPRAVPLSETVHGIALQDEYRWMEDSTNQAELNAWIKAESADARKALEALPSRAAFMKELAAVSSGLVRVRDLQMAGDISVFRKSATGDRTPKLMVRKNGEERVLLDPNGASGGSIAAINNVSLSPDGRMVAVHTATGGAEVGSIQVYDVATGKPVGVPITDIWGEFRLIWLGGDVVSYTRMAPAGEFKDPLMGMRAYVKRLSDEGPGTPALGGTAIEPKIDAKDFPRISAAPASPWAVANAAGARVDGIFWVARTSSVIDGRAVWRPIAKLDDRVGDVETLGDSVFLLTTKENSAGTVYRRSLSDAEIGPSVKLFEGRDTLILAGLVAVTEGLYVTAKTEGVTRIFFSRSGTSAFSEIKLPMEGGSIIDLQRGADGNGINFGLSGWLSNFRYFAIRDGQVRETGIAASTWAGASNYEAEQLAAKSADGTSVPLVVIRRKGARGPAPTMLQGYGGYGFSSTEPFYMRDSMAWLAHGGTLAYCGTRGGGERGRAWHEGGKGIRKPNAHADFIACAELLKSAKIATPKGAVATGVSMGGTLVPPAVLKRPDLFAAMISGVGVVNPSRIGAAVNGANQFDEIGDPNTPEGFKALWGMDAYQMVPDAKGLPATLLSIGMNDKRVNPWMSAKFAARVKAKFDKSRVVWIRSDDDAGHGIGTAEAARIAESADRYAFAWERAN
jgi:prolyl oligopeptidase